MSGENDQVLLSLGYVWLDVRPQTDVDERGKIRDSFHVPLVIERRRFDAEQVSLRVLFGK